MKEIGKLIELLNEYEKKSAVHWYEWYGQDVLMCRYFIVKDGFEFYTDEAATIAISKYYGFIKWLVDNDKIDRDEIIINSDFMPIAFDRKGEKYEWSEEKQLLMLLSISDTPIEDLILYLK